MTSANFGDFWAGTSLHTSEKKFWSRSSVSLGLKVTWGWVEGHAIECKGWLLCTVAEHFNYQANLLAKTALQNVIFCRRPYEGDFPFKMLSLKIWGQWVSCSPCHTLQEQWGYSVTKALFAEKNIIQPEKFSLVWWKDVATTMSSYPKMHSIWLTEHVSEFCSNNVQLYCVLLE